MKTLVKVALGAVAFYGITRTSIDMRTIDIWYQLMSWLNENEF